MKPHPAVFPLLFLIFAACASAQDKTMGKNQQQDMQGIEGKVVWKEGNLMPTVGIGDQGQPKNEGKGVQRTIWVYQPTHLGQATKVEGAFFSNISTSLVKRFRTQPDGTFSIDLPPGSYSLFCQEEKGFYANRFDGQGNIFVVEVKEGGMTQVEILLDYMAAY